ncbi:UTP--glucose-1-phosphate uridylyltransferase GalU [Halobacillus sp. ACCC02827]|uniref:UTP--glucose-1-phosphate uridylyltransferase GalU n=1 Tax=Bacillaceae TaxID=186817 RepID=UPI0002A51205|nr:MULTISPECIES: UTP--glucose-1-phosphate uridylyltransferase GalU [Bacillaceae]ELK46363.1 UTP-glucose-1-phosphate uridylyltransferase [Halobacillus sp. BAB-2008]QHT48334.1 UTP--glucose-1-phosphate uridylyltransferase GalU [Bacillus sp. SB49]WJE15571.1 UTP--glucose-1-phosphate uridylyltransferase GalU [Halobacillus sp. ACCC02827]
MNIKKAIIPAAGFGTRFLPATKAQPKEMLPIVDKPTIQYIVEEAIAAGIEEIIIVTGKGKRSIEDHFDHAFELEANLKKKGKWELLEEVQYCSGLADIHYIRQKEPKGLGHAIWCARKFIGEEPFAVLLGDDIVRSDYPGIRQLMDVYDETGASVIAVQEVAPEETHRYGVIAPTANTGRKFEVGGFVEKPVQGTAPSNFAIIGRYVLTPEIFAYLDKQEIGAGGEVQLTDAIDRLNRTNPVYAWNMEGRRYDVGEKVGFVQTTIDFALEREELKDELLAYLRDVVALHEEQKLRVL